MRSRQTVKTKITTLKTSDGKLTQTDEETADVVINQFQSVFVDEGVDSVHGVVGSVIDMVSNSLAEPDNILQWTRLKTNF